MPYQCEIINPVVQRRFQRNASPYLGNARSSRPGCASPLGDPAAGASARLGEGLLKPSYGQLAVQIRPRARISTTFRPRCGAGRGCRRGSQLIMIDWPRRCAGYAQHGRRTLQRKRPGHEPSSRPVKARRSSHGFRIIWIQPCASHVSTASWRIVVRWRECDATTATVDVSRQTRTRSRPAHLTMSSRTELHVGNAVSRRTRRSTSTTDIIFVSPSAQA